MSNTPHDSQGPSPLGSALADAIERVAPAVFHVLAQDRRASGVVWSAADDLVVTSARLFDGQREAPISLVGDDGRTRSATLVGLDEATELALVKVKHLDDSPLAEASWTDEARAARVGTFVAPVARTESGLRATLGMVTRVGPAWVTARGGTVERYLDVDGTLPPGFSGGPLVGFDGQILGVNTRGLVSGGATLPTETVRRVATLLAAGGTTAPGHLGVAIASVDLPEHLRAGHASGLLVTGVVASSAAERAGIGPGDVIVAIDGHATPDHAHLLAALAGKVGRAVRVKLARHGQSVEVEATPEARAERRREASHGGACGGPFEQLKAHGFGPWARAFFGGHGPHGGHGRHGHGGRGCR